MQVNIIESGGKMQKIKEEKELIGQKKNKLLIGKIYKRLLD